MQAKTNREDSMQQVAVQLKASLKKIIMIYKGIWHEFATKNPKLTRCHVKITGRRVKLQDVVWVFVCVHAQDSQREEHHLIEHLSNCIE